RHERILVAQMGGEALTLVVTRRRGVERGQTIGLSGFERLEHLFLRHPRLGGQLGDGRRAAELLGEPADAVAEGQVELLHAAGRSYRPALVTKVPLELSRDGVGGIGRELDASSWVEAVDRLEQGHRADLDEIVDRLSPMAE